MKAPVKKAIALQGRVIWALCLREIQGKHGKSRLGYLWQIVKTGFTVAVFWVIRAMGGLPTPYDIPVPIYLLMGVIPWFIFSESVKLTMDAVSSNEALLTFPQITTLDLMLSCCMVAWATEILVLLLYCLLFSQIGYQFTLYDPLAFSCGLIGICLFGLGAGMILTAINLYVPVTEKLVPMVLRVLFFTSGVFFSPTGRFGVEYNWFFEWNPLCNFFELMRGAFAFSTPREDIKIGYLVCLTVYSLGAGLLLERFVRPKQGTVI